MNVRRGLIRIWVIITLAIAIVTTLLIYRPLIAWMQLKDTIGLEVSHNNLSNEIRIGVGYDNLSADEKVLAVMRAMYLLGLKADDLTKCDAFQTELSGKLRDALSTHDNEMSELISNRFPPKHPRLLRPFRKPVSRLADSVRS